MGFRSIYINFDNTSRSFFSGEVVSGRVVIVTASQKNCKGIKIQFIGQARVHWEQSVAAAKASVISADDAAATANAVSTAYNSAQNYFYEEAFLSGDGLAEISLEPGQHTYPFHFVLPENLPSSFEGNYGWVRYSVEVSVIRPWRFDYKVIEMFTVNGVLDLNTETSAILPSELRMCKSLGYLMCKGGSLGIILKIPRRGYVPGEFIPFVAELTNMSTRKIKTVSISLIQNASFTSCGGYQKTESKLLSYATGPEIMRGDIEIWSDDVLQVPAVPPTRLGNNCSSIDVFYKIQVKMEISGQVVLRGEMPILIGTIPFRDRFESYRPFGLMEPPLWSPVSKYPDLPPPSYEEAITFDLPNYKAAIGDSNSRTEKNRKNDKKSNKPHSNSLSKHASDHQPASFIPKYVTYSIYN